MILLIYSKWWRWLELLSQQLICILPAHSLVEFFLLLDLPEEMTEFLNKMLRLKHPSPTFKIEMKLKRRLTILSTKHLNMLIDNKNFGGLLVMSNPPFFLLG
jgi:hypothetical protein